MDDIKRDQTNTGGGALNIPDDKSGRIGSDAELKEKTPQTKPQPTGEDAPAPVADFDPPVLNGERRIFQNGDTDRGP